MCKQAADQNDGWIVPYPYLMVCCKNIYLKMLFCKAYIFIPGATTPIVGCILQPSSGL